MNADKARKDKLIRGFSTDSELVAFLKDVLTKDKADRFNFYAGYLQGYAPFDGMVGIMSRALVISGADAGDIEKAIATLDDYPDDDQVGL